MHRYATGSLTHFIKKMYASAHSSGVPIAFTRVLSADSASSFALTASGRPSQSYEILWTASREIQDDLLTSVSIAPGQMQLTRMGAKSTANPRAAASNAPAPPARNVQSLAGGLTTTEPGKQHHHSLVEKMTPHPHQS